MLVQMLLQLGVDVRLFSQYTPKKKADGKQADREDLPPGPLMLAPHGAVNFPGFVTGFTGGKLHGFTFHLIVFVCRLS